MTILTEIRRILRSFFGSISDMVMIISCFCYGTVNADVSDDMPGRASWYGDRQGAGSTGGACGYGFSVAEPPYSSFITAAAPALFGGGKNCGACYQVSCQQHPACSGLPVTVVVSDSCPGCPGTLFDMSGTAFGAMAKPSQADNLLNAGQVPIMYQRVSCRFRSSLAFTLAPGSTNFYIRVVVKFVNGFGTLTNVELQPAGSPAWMPMQQLENAAWYLNGGPLQGPFSVRLTSAGRTIVAANVIPANWVIETTYWANTNF